MATLREQFIAFDKRLASYGVKPCSDWWRDGIERWLDAYERGCVLELWACVGRGAAKSTALYKLALFFTLYGDVEVPPGERHYAIVLSRLKEEAEKGIGIIAAWLRLLDIPHRQAGDVVELLDDRRGIRVVAASVAATSGWRAFFVGKDERSKWPTGGAADLDAEEIDTSAAAMTATHPRAPVVSVGSAWGMFGAFYDAITGGDDANRVVLGPAPTWIAAPHIGEADTRRKERDERKWRREYACEFQAGALSAFDADAVARAFTPRGEVGSSFGPFGIIDASSGKKDTWSFGVASWRGGWNVAHRRLVFDHVDGIEGRFWTHDAGERVVSRIATAMKERGVRNVFGDQRESLMLASAFSRHGLRFVELPWTAPRKERGVMTVRRWLADDVLVLPAHEKLRREMLSFEERITPSGALTFAGGRGENGRDDYVALLITAAIADSEPKRPGVPHVGGSPVSGNRMVDALRIAIARERGELIESVEPKPLSEALAAISAHRPKTTTITLADAPDARALGRLIR